MLTASTLSPFSVSRVMMVCTHSYRIALPAFFAVSVLLATCQHERSRQVRGMVRLHMMDVARSHQRTHLSYSQCQNSWVGKPGTQNDYSYFAVKERICYLSNGHFPMIFMYPNARVYDSHHSSGSNTLFVPKVSGQHKMSNCVLLRRCVP